MRLKGKKVITLVDQEFEDLELWYPILRLQEEGTTVHLVGPEANVEYKGQKGIPVKSDYSYDEVDASDYDGILVPGGWAPDKIRRYPDALNLIKAMDDAQKPIGQVCHAGWVLISANILQGKKVTSTPAIKDDMINAGATWTDEPLVVDGHLFSSRRPADLPQYMKAFADKLAE